MLGLEKVKVDPVEIGEGTDNVIVQTIVRCGSTSVHVYNIFIRKHNTFIKSY